MSSTHLTPNCSLSAPGVVDGVQSACACQSKDGKNTPMPCGPATGLGYAASDQCMPQVCHKIEFGNMKGHCHNELCPTCGSGVIRGPGVAKFHLRDNSCGNNDPNAQFFGEATVLPFRYLCFSAFPCRSICLIEDRCLQTPCTSSTTPSSRTTWAVSVVTCLLSMRSILPN